MTIEELKQFSTTLLREMYFSTGILHVLPYLSEGIVELLTATPVCYTCNKNLFLYIQFLILKEKVHNTKILTISGDR